MSKWVLRLGLAFAVLAVGLGACGFVAVNAIATSVVDEKTAPVKRQLEADWAGHQAQLQADLKAVAAWGELHEKVPADLGCRLSWQPASREAVVRHLARCGAAAPAIPEALAEQLRELGDEVLRREAELPKLEHSFAWMAELRGHDDWLAAEGTPWEFEPTDLRVDLPVSWAIPEMFSVLQPATLRLVEGVRAGALEEAVLDVTAYARALMGAPVVMPQVMGVAVLQNTRAQLDALGRPELGVPAAEVQALRHTRRAGGFVWHPWVPGAVREPLLPALPEASRCAAALEMGVTFLLGELLVEHYPQVLADFERQRQQPGACRSPLVARVLASAQDVPREAWVSLLNPELLGTTSDATAGAGLLPLAARLAPKARGAVTEAVLAVMAAQPFEAAPAP